MTSGFPCAPGGLMLPGPAGQLEAITTCPDPERKPAAKPQPGRPWPAALGHESLASRLLRLPSATAVVCHPHPQHGGTMRNKVVHTLARAFEIAGARSLRFNFRGVGLSEGVFGDIVGETEDALAVLNWVRERRPDDELWLAGFSFGAAVALRAAARFPVARLITVAPAVHLYPDLEALEPPAVPWLLVIGTADEVVPPETVLAWARGRRHPPELALLEGAGHFFHQRLPELRESILQHLAGPA